MTEAGPLNLIDDNDDENDNSQPNVIKSKLTRRCKHLKTTLFNLTPFLLINRFLTQKSYSVHRQNRQNSFRPNT